MEQLFLTGYQENQQTKLGLQKGDTLYALDASAIPSLEWLLQNVSASELTSRLDQAVTNALPADTAISLKGLLNHQPVWAAGVTYKISEEARERESANSTVYTRVYSAERPEVFSKAIGYETVSSGDHVGIRYDATWSVPEPELTVVFNARKEVIGFTIGNDMSSRDIEGENPLYLPQAKVYTASCALGPGIVLNPATEWPSATISMKIERGGSVVVEGDIHTSRIKRTLSDLAQYLGRCYSFPDGVALLTGTGVVPPSEFTLAAGDVVTLSIEGIGELKNRVKVV